MNPQQAFRLGLGEGTTNAGDPALISNVLTRPIEACLLWSGDLEPVAWYGYRCRGLTYIDEDEKARRAVYTAAARFFLLGDFGYWDEVLARALDGTSAPSDTAWVQSRTGYEQLRGTKWDRKHSHFRSAMQDYAGGSVYEDLTDDYVPHGTCRSLARLFLLTEPTDGRIAQWLLLIARTAQQHAT